MVKPGGEPPEEADTASSPTALILSSPEWNFPAISRPKTKRVGTPFPERSRRALKRSGLESGSEVCRVKKKMIFEMAETFFAGKHGEGRKTPEEGQIPAGEMLSSLAKLARPVLVMTSNVCPVVMEPSNFTMGEESKVDSCSHGATELGQVATEPGRSCSSPPAKGETGDSSPTIISTVEDVDQSKGLMKLDGTPRAEVTEVGDDSTRDSPKKYGPHHLLEYQLHACSNLVNLDNAHASLHVESSIGQRETCDYLKDEGANHSLLLHDIVSTSWANNDKSSHVEANQLRPHSLVNNVDQLLPDKRLNPCTTADVCMPETSPEKCQTGDLPSNQVQIGEPGDGATGSKDEGESDRKEDSIFENGEARKSEPANLYVDQIKEMGMAGSCEGIPSLSFSDEETKLLADKLGYAIIGKFSHTIPSPQQIQKSLSNIQFVDGFKWKAMNAKHILIQFRDVCDYGRMLNGPNGAPVWFIENHPMRVFKWTPNFDTFFESPIAAVWCKLIGIPIHLYEHSALIAIGKLLGKPIQADHATINQTRLTFARICVEIDISIPPPKEIILNILGMDTRYKVVWERLPSYCVECKHVGHTQEECLALGKKKLPMKDHNHATIPQRPNSRHSHVRREWRPKGPKADNQNHQPVHYAASKEEHVRGPPEGKKEADASTSGKATKVAQVQVDEDGFQLVSRRKRGKKYFPLQHDQDSPHKAPYLEKLLMGGNVATVSFGETDVGMIDPGASPTVCIS